jgi:hypothetical protein
MPAVATAIEAMKAAEAELRREKVVSRDQARALVTALLDTLTDFRNEIMDQIEGLHVYLDTHPQLAEPKRLRQK